MADTASACIVTYVEALGLVAHDARRILADYAHARADAPGVASIELLMRDAVSGQFALVETGSLAAVSGDDTAAARNAALAPMLLAPCDVRTHGALSVAALGSPAPAGARWIVTHVDVVPAHRDSGVARVRGHAETSRGRRGCLRFEAWQQVDRPNHMTLVEVWADTAAHDDHRATDDTRGFRDHLAPVSGALYDERVYTRLDP